MTGMSVEETKQPLRRGVSDALHSADDRRLVIVVLISAIATRYVPWLLPATLTAAALMVWFSLERHVSIFNASFALKRQQTARMRLDFVAGLLVTVAYIFAIARTVGVLVGEGSQIGPLTVLYFCALGASMTWVVFNQGWEFPKAFVAFAAAGGACLLALTLGSDETVHESTLPWTRNVVRVACLSGALHLVTWRSAVGTRVLDTTLSPGLWLRSAIFVAMLAFAVEPAPSAAKHSDLERWIWRAAAAAAIGAVVVEMIRARADLLKEWRAFVQIARGISVPPRRRRLGIWTQIALFPASATLSIATWLEWGICLALGLLASVIAVPRFRRNLAPMADQ